MSLVVPLSSAELLPQQNFPASARAKRLWSPARGGFACVRQFCPLLKQRSLSLCRVQVPISAVSPHFRRSPFWPSPCPFVHGHSQSLWAMTLGLCSVNDPPSSHDLIGAEPHRGVTRSGVPETLDLSSFPSAVAAAVIDLALVAGGVWCDTPMTTSFPRAQGARCLTCPAPRRLLHLVLGGLSQLRRGTVSACVAMD